MSLISAVALRQFSDLGALPFTTLGRDFSCVVLFTAMASQPRRCYETSCYFPSLFRTELFDRDFPDALFDFLMNSLSAPPDFYRLLHRR